MQDVHGMSKQSTCIQAEQAQIRRPLRPQIHVLSDDQ